MPEVKNKGGRPKSKPKPKPKPKPEGWCPRCVEREEAPDPRAPLRDTRHESFARNIALVGLKNQKAYTESGFESKNMQNISNASTKLRRRLDVKNRIIALSERAIQRDLKTRDWVDDQLKEVVDRCMQEIPVMLNGKKTGEWKFDARGANTALQLMGKDRGMFVDQIKIIEDELINKTPDEIADITRAAAIELGRDFIRQLGESVGIFETDRDETDRDVAGEAEKSASKPVSPLH